MSHDLIILGTGGVGSSALFHAAERDLSVLGLDRFPPAHDRGSSHGETRMIRQSYFENPAYVPLLRASYRLWDELVERTGEALFQRTGVAYFGRPEGGLLSGVQASSETHGIPIESVSADDFETRWPGFAKDDSHEVLFEPDAGYLRVEDCIAAYLREAVRLGAEHRHGETILGWEESGDGVEVRTDRGSYQADRLIVTAGCWSSQLLTELRVPLKLVRKHLHWFEVDEALYGEASGFPCFAHEFGGDCFYGFPSAGAGLKLAEHTGGDEIEDPLEASRELDPTDTERIEHYLACCFPQASRKRIRHEVCFYTNSPDEHYLVDRLPGSERVAFAAGLSGHGFKNASALGHALADLVTGEKPIADVGFLGMGRFG